MNLVSTWIRCAWLLVALLPANLPASAPTEAGRFEIEVWLVELPREVPGESTLSLPLPGRLQLSDIDSATWLESTGGENAASSHLLLEVKSREEFSVELPTVGCSFHGTGSLQEGTIVFELVTIDNPNRPEMDCALGKNPTPSSSPAGRASARENRLAVRQSDTMVFVPVDRGDGRRRLILWRAGNR
ncbi:MAG: hypothetical protein DVB23_001611 [Verrucomicrobia bacterium]|jgi:hypothetical protein|nr:MAG: hypothetical protein DVB23_001611 [Verrucomicrobiota bacterium]